MPRTPGSKKLTLEKKVAIALFLVDLAGRGTGAVAAVKSAMATSKLGKIVEWEIWRSRKDAASLVRERPRKPKFTKQIKDEIARLVTRVLDIARQTLQSQATR
ncbi:hypothetical protein F443_23142, partial [Phytophthora nicotianae P1569]